MSSACRFTARHSATVVLVLLVTATLILPASAEDILQAPRVLEALPNSNYVQVADLNGDDILDLAGREYATGFLLVQLGLPDGGFSDPQLYDCGENSTSLLLVDLNGDGYPDAVVGIWEGGCATLLNAGDGTFGTPQYCEAAEWPRGLASCDLEGDGNRDIIISDEWNDLVYVLRGDGSGALTLVNEFSVQGPEALAAGDFDGDGLDDLAVGSSWGEQVFVYSGNGDGTFNVPLSLTLQSHALELVTVDLDRDEDLDLVAACGFYNEGGFLMTFFGDGTGGFFNGDTLVSGGLCSALVATDLNGDQFPDVLLADAWNDVLRIYRSDGGQSLLPAGQYATRSATNSLAVADLDGDGILDVVDSGPAEHLVIYPGLGGGVFQSFLRSPAGDLPVQAIPLHLDGDNHWDMAVVNTNVSDGGNNSLELLRGLGNGGFALQASLALPGIAYQGDAGDLDGDGRHDLAITTLGNRSLLVFLADGDFSFSDPVEYPESNRVNAVTLDDFDGDGNLDAALACGYNQSSGGQAVILLGDGSGILTRYGAFAAGGYPRDIAAAELNGDGHLDLILPGLRSEDLTMLPGNGDGSFGNGLVSPAPGTPRALAVCDLDQDGIPDAALVHENHDQLSVHLGNGTGLFTEIHRCPTGGNPADLLALDLTDDLQPDLAVLNRDGQTLQVLRGDGEGNFETGWWYATNSAPETLCSVDLDRDGINDLVVSDRSDNSICTFRGLAGQSLPTAIATGPGTGQENPPLVRIFAIDASGASQEAEWVAYGATGYGVNVALGDLDGEVGAEVLTGPGPGAVYGPHVRGFTVQGAPLPGVSFLAYGTLRYGVNVTAGDIDGDGFSEIFTGAGPGAVFGPHVRGWNWDGADNAEPFPGLSWFAYSTPKWGVNVCCGDVDGDGYDEVITGAGPGAVYGPHVRGWNVESGIPQAIPGLSFLAYGTNRYGVNVSCGDIDGDGFSEIVTGPGPGELFAPHVRGWNWDGSGDVHPIPGVNFFAFDQLHWGVNVSCGDLDQDGIDEILSGNGPGPDFNARVRGWNYDGSALTPMVNVDFTSYPPEVALFGAKVAAP